MEVARMLDKVMVEQLHELRLGVMAQKLAEQQENSDMMALSFDERLGMIVEAEWIARKTRRVERHISQANFRFPAMIEDIEYHGKHGITKQDVLRLSDSGYIHKKQNILICGPTGVGKTYLVCALGRCACLGNIQARYIRTSDLFYELADAQMAGNYPACKRKLGKLPLLILDDWGMRPFTLEESHEIMELMEMRYQNGSTIIAGQLPHTEWHQLFPDPTLSDAILDRVVHNAHKFNIQGESMRKILAEKEMVRTE
jgi:DNA replication protein DnaC